MLKPNQLPIRRLQRVATNSPAMLVVESEKGQSIFRGTAIDSSEKGVRIKTSFTSLTNGQTIEVVLLGDLKRALRCRVAWVRQPGPEHSGQFGLEFMGPVLALS